MYPLRSASNLRGGKTRMKPKLLAISICLSFLLGLAEMCAAQDLQSMASTISQRIAASGRKSVAVTDFTDLDGRPTKLGRFLAEEFSDALFSQAKGFDVIDRTHPKAILQEHKLATTGLIDPATARKLGQIAGVETLVTWDNYSLRRARSSVSQSARYGDRENNCSGHI